jgi:hypothetical protein
MDTRQLESQLAPFFTKQLPSLPENIKDLLVKLAPYFAIIGVIISLPAILAVLGLGTIAAPFAALGGVSSFTNFSLSIIFVIINTVIMAMAIPGLFARTYKGWQLMFIGTIISAVSSLLSMNLGSLILGTAISFYFLFQVKSYYK